VEPYTPGFDVWPLVQLLEDMRRSAEAFGRSEIEGFDVARQPNGDRLAASIEKSLQIQAIDGSANGNRTRKSGSRPFPSITRGSLLVRVFAFFSPDRSLQSR
jgi:hypothetical protein